MFTESQSAFAKRLGVSRQRVSKGLQEGLVPAAYLTTGPKGPVIADPERAAAAWRAAVLTDRRPFTGPGAKAAPARSAPGLVLGGLEPGQEPFIAIRFPLAAFLAGAAAALRAAGRQPTNAALRELVAKADELVWWERVVAAMAAALDDELTPKDLDRMWELEGREAAEEASRAR